MVTLTYGLKRPQTRDTGSTLFTALEDNITQLDAHSHDGITSALLSTASLVATTQTISSASWGAAVSTGRYRQTITLPGSLSLTNCYPLFKDANGIGVLLTWEKVTTTTYYVYTNDSSQNYTAVYVS